jgi:hypothetical protein
VHTAPPSPEVIILFPKNEYVTKSLLSFKLFFELIGDVLPCRYCRDSYKEFIKEPETKLNENVMKNRNTFTKYKLVYRVVLFITI